MEDINEITDKIIGAAIEVHRALGPGLLESAYEECLAYELRLHKLDVKRQVEVPLVYKGIMLDCCYRMDLLVDNRVVVELKTVEHLLPIHEAQLLSYLKITEHKVGLLLNFHAEILIHGLKRMVNNL